jgi:hypothetical protein
MVGVHPTHLTGCLMISLHTRPDTVGQNLTRDVSVFALMARIHTIVVPCIARSGMGLRSTSLVAVGAIGLAEPPP